MFAARRFMSSSASSSSRSKLISQHLAKTAPTTTNNFHSSARKMVQVGDSIPSVDLFEAKPSA
jgi:hypothetical protein